MSIKLTKSILGLLGILSFVGSFNLFQETFLSILDLGVLVLVVSVIFVIVVRTKLTIVNLKNYLFNLFIIVNLVVINFLFFNMFLAEDNCKTETFVFDRIIKTSYHQVFYGFVIKNGVEKRIGLGADFNQNKKSIRLCVSNGFFGYYTFRRVKNSIR